MLSDVLVIVWFPSRLLAAHPFIVWGWDYYAHAYAMASGWSVQLVILCGHVPVLWGNYKIGFVLKAMVITWTAFELSLNGWRGHWKAHSTLSLYHVLNSLPRCFEWLYKFLWLLKHAKMKGNKRQCDGVLHMAIHIVYLHWDNFWAFVSYAMSTEALMSFNATIIN